MKGMAIHRRLTQIDREIKDLEKLRSEMVGTLYPGIVTADIAKLRKEQAFLRRAAQ